MSETCICFKNKFEDSDAYIQWLVELEHGGHVGGIASHIAWWQTRNPIYAAGITHTAYLCFIEDTMEGLGMRMEEDLG